MENFKSIYLGKCKELLIEPNACVLAALNGKSKDGKHPHRLDLSGQAIPLKACSALAAALSQDVVFTHLILADAFLGDDGK